jgi:hypothetical protein
MTTRKALLLAAAFAAAVLACGVAAGDEPPPGKGGDDEIDRLIRQLGSDDFDAREEATRRLADRDDALTKLREAAKSADGETKQRAEKLVAAITRRLEEKAFPGLVAEVNKGGLDRFIDQMATRKGFATPERWELAYQLARAAAARASKLGGKEFRAPELDLSKMAVLAASPPAGPSDAKVLLEGGDRGDGETVAGCLLISGGPLAEQIVAVQGSVVFVNGDIKGCGSVSESVVVCNGEIGYVNEVRNSVLVATGGFAGSTGADGCFFDVRSVGGHTRSRDNVYVNLKEVAAKRSERNQFIPTEEGPLRMFKFFDPASMGLAVSAADGWVKVDEVRGGTPFAKAGFAEGDLVLGLGKGPFASPEHFRRFLRRRGAGDEAVFKVQRGDRVVELKVEFAD